MARSAAKERLVYPLQRWAVNPILPLKHILGIPSPGGAVLETTGRTRLPQRSPEGKLQASSEESVQVGRAGVAGLGLGRRSLGRWVGLPDAGQGPPQLSP